MFAWDINWECGWVECGFASWSILSNRRNKIDVLQQHKLNVLKRSEVGKGVRGFLCIQNNILKVRNVHTKQNSVFKNICTRPHSRYSRSIVCWRKEGPGMR